MFRISGKKIEGTQHNVSAVRMRHQVVTDFTFLKPTKCVFQRTAAARRSDSRFVPVHAKLGGRSPSLSPTSAQQGKQGGSKTHNNARLSLYACGQDGPAFMAAFAGRTKLGLFDRLYPEFSGPIEAGDLPEINQSDVLSLPAKIAALKFDAKMTMRDSTRLDLGIFWSAQPVEIRRKSRFKKYLTLDMYMAAFGRGVTVAEAEDLAVAI